MPRITFGIPDAVHAKEIAAIGSETFIKGTATVKKNNFADHVKKGQTHATAVLRLAKDEKISQCTSANACSTLGTASGATKQSTLPPYLQKLSARQRLQLTNKFQLAHFLISLLRFMGKCCRLRKVYTTSIWGQATTVIERQKKLIPTSVKVL